MLASLLFSLSAALTVQATELPPAQEDDVLLSAERVYREDENGKLIAEGDVRAASEERFVRADRVIYDPETGLVTAEGNVAVKDENGQLYFGDTVVLSKDLRNGIAEAFAAELAPNGTLGAASAIRRANGKNELRRAKFTLCEVCDEGLRADRPVWQLKARRVIQDEENKVLRFRDAFLEIFGVPLIYTPYAQLPDPSVERASGILPPEIGGSTRRGTEVELPYYFAISNYQDFTFSPRNFSDLGLLMKGEYRRNTHNSDLIIQAGVINPTNDLTEEGGDPDSTRWHWFSRYRRDLPMQWQLEADIDGVSDKGYSLIYDIAPEGELQEEINILRPDRLASNLSFSRNTEQSRTDLTGYLFQTLRLNEDQRFTAQALPRIRHDRFYKAPGGEITVGGSLLSLLREDGVDSFRGSAHLRYQGVKLTRSGHRFEAYGEVRGDHYAYRDADQGIQPCNVADRFYNTCRQFLPRDGQETEFQVSRFLPTIGAEWSYPLARIGENTSFIIEPRVQAVVSPTRSFRDDIFNEDSQFFQFDQITLFDYNKSTGLDLWEDGQRVNAGVSGTAALGSGLTVNGMIGNQFRREQSDAFDDEGGIGEVQSDYVGAVDIRIGKNLVLDNRFRIDDDTGAFRRLESLVSSRIGPLSANLNYLRVESDDFETNQILDEFLTVSAAWRVNKHLSIAARQAQNLDSGESTQTEFAVRLANRCAAVSIRYRFDNSTVAGFEQDEEILVKFDILGFN
ncbi:LPS-assembly protein LptD [Parvularcula sp. ZS-1/3]|uniref:LPS-assembly protein LptD n=1 Tax=Parvularcula mediterranea TaxID=2732508 RepID=A0A7Y3W5H5_9PROT|nr:LPS assembly protein LptD [Parvularcula mediterranea]NNU16281.1 LPS-assembly protein LptD [Parvularcula mediterranea]